MVNLVEHEISRITSGPGLPKSSTTDNPVQAIHCMVMIESKLLQRSCASYGSVYAALRELPGRTFSSVYFLPGMKSATNFKFGGYM